MPVVRAVRSAEFYHLMETVEYFELKYKTAGTYNQMPLASLADLTVNFQIQVKKNSEWIAVLDKCT